MSFTYCKLCGHKNLYSVSAPKFCGECGASLTGGSSSVVKPPPKRGASSRKKRTRDTASLASLDEEGLDIDHVPQLDKLQYEVLDTDSYARVMDMKDLIPEFEKGSSEKKAKTKRKRKRKA
jgi:hypothetical protein